MFSDFRVQQRDQLLEIARAISQELEPDRVLEKILRFSVDMLGGGAGIITLPQDEDGSWRLAASVGVPSPFLRDLKTALSDPPRRADPVTDIQQRLQRILRVQSLGMLSSLGLPMTVRESIVGAVFVFRTGTARFTHDDRSLLQSFADQAAVAVSNARLFAQVRAEKQRLDAILDSSSEGIAILSAGNRIQRFNRAMSRMTGTPPDRALGAAQDKVIRLTKIRDGQTLSQAEAGGWPLSNQSTLYLEGDLLRESGDTLSVSVSYVPVFSPEGALLNVIAEMRDLTRFREAEELKDTFISIISHELKTPVALIKGYASTLRREDAVWDKSIVQDSLAVIEEESDRLTALIEDLLDASRLQAGGLRPNLSEVRLPDLAGRLVDRFRRQAPEYTFEAAFPPGYPSIPADEERIGQVLSNLLSNAVKYSPAGSRVEVRGTLHPDRLEISVSDHGAGIPVEDLPHIFKRFYRTDDAVKRTKGAGLGLYLAKAVVEAHGGRIWVESQPGQGTRVSFSLPRNAPDTLDN